MADVLTYLGAGYLALFFIKMMFLLPSMPHAVIVMSQKLTGKKFALIPFVMVFLGLPITTFVMLIPALRSEGLRFFWSPTNYTVTREILQAHKDCAREADDR